MNRIIPIIIPAYEPDRQLVELVRELVDDEDLIVIVDDGSGSDYVSIFEECSNILGDKGIVLTHDMNKGKGTG